MATIATILRKDKLNKKGLAPIHFRIIKDRKTRYVSARFSIEPKYWNTKKEIVKPSHPESSYLNTHLSEELAKIQEDILKHEATSKELTVSKIKEKVLGKKPVAFIPFAMKALENYKIAGQVGTYDKSKSIIKKLKTYLDGQELFFHDITVKFLTDYEKWLREKLGNKTNTVHKDLKFIRKLFNDCIRQDLILANLNPFLRYKLKLEKTQKVYLTEDELIQFEQVQCTPYARLELHQDMFIFASYVGGLRVSDVLKLQKLDFDGTHIHVNIKKTRGQLSIKLPNKALSIIEKWKEAPNASERFIFPMLDESIDLEDPFILDKNISSCTAYINKNLKILTKQANIDKHVSFHISRHTWATRALKKGMSVDKVSKLMGHAALRETLIYAKIVNEELDKAMDVFND